MSLTSSRGLRVLCLILLGLFTLMISLIYMYKSPSIAQGADGSAPSVYVPLVDQSSDATIGVSATQGVIYYVSPTGKDSNSGTSAGQPWATFARAWQSVRAGDTLILLDGTYNQSLDPSQSGTPNNPITVRAQNDGKAIIDGQGVRTPISLTTDYYVIEGITARNGGETVVLIQGHYNILRRISGYDAGTDINSRVYLLQGNHNQVEDCIAAGSGRKMMLIFMSEYNTVRRCFIHWQEWDGRNWSDAWPWGDGLDIYNANNNIVENVISYGSNPTHHFGLVSQGDPPDGGVTGNKVLGSMAINAGMTEDGKPVVWGNTRPQPTQYTAIRDFNWPGQRSGFNIYEGQFISDNLFQDDLSWGNAGLGLAWVDNGNFSTGNNRINRATMFHNGLANPASYGGIGVDAMKQDLGEFASVDNSRIATIFGGTAATGEGARLSNRYVDGVLMDGSNGQPTQSLWPWPMESRIQTELGISVNSLIGSITGLNTNPGGGPAPTPTATSKPGATPTPAPTATSKPDTTPTPAPTAINTPDIPSPPPSGHRVNLPYLGTWPPAQSNYTPAIFWLGKVSSTSNYADVRMAYYADHLEIFVHVIDRFLWSDDSPALSDLTKWDAVSIYLDRAGTNGQAPKDTAFRFIKQLGTSAASQAVYQGNGSGWSAINVPFAAESSWRGTSPNDLTDDRGWIATLHIPFTSLGLSEPPTPGSIWGIAVALHDRDDAAGTAIPDQLWPGAMNPLQSDTWGQLSFGASVYNAPPTVPDGKATIRQGLQGATVPDAAVGGHGNCGGGKNDWTEWGNANYAGYDQFNIQNQWDIADFSCFSKYYVTFPLDSLPVGKAVISASVTLNMFGNAGYNPGDAKPSSIEVLSVGQNWDEKSISWNNAPLAVENISTAWVNPIDDSHPAGSHSWDVSRAAAQAYKLGQPLRLVFYSTDGDYHSGKYFWSSDVADWNAASRPTLNIAWGDSISTPPGPTAVGNVSCDAGVDVVDALFILQYDVGLKKAAAQCPLSSSDTLYLPACDVNKDAACNIMDALFVLQCTVGVTNPWCSAIASGVSTSDVKTTLPPDKSTIASITVPSVDAASGQTATLSIMASAPDSRIGATVVEVQYDPNLLEPTVCAPDPSALFNQSSCNPRYEANHSDPDVLRLNLVSATGATGDLRLADVTFRVKGKSGNTAVVKVNPVAWTANGAPMTINSQSAEIRVTGVVGQSPSQKLYLPMAVK